MFNKNICNFSGPLELIQKNILHTDESVELAVKEGQIQFIPTNEGVLGKPQISAELSPVAPSSINEDSNQSISDCNVIKSESHDNIFSNVQPKISVKRRASDVGQQQNLNLNYSRREAPGKDTKKSKKAKGQNNMEKRPFKFHEYKVNLLLKIFMV